MTPPAAWQVIDFESHEGVYPVRRFLAGLNSEEKDVACALIRLLQKWSNRLKMPRSEPLGEGLFELRDDSGVRIFYTFLPGYRAALLGGIVKKRTSIPSEILGEMRRRCAAVKKKKKEKRKKETRRRGD